MSSVSLDNLPSDYRFNTPKRREFQSKSFFYKLTHPVEKTVVKYDFYVEVLKYFDDKFEIHNLQQTDRVWDYILKSRRIHWNKGSDLTVEKFKRIEKAFEEALIHRGPGVNFPLEGRGDIHNVVEYLFTVQEQIHLRGFSCETLKEILFATDERFLATFRAKLEEALNVGLQTFQERKVSEKAFRGFVYHIVSLLPYTYPPEGAIVQIPAKVGNEWKLVPYTVDKKFEMTPSWFSSPIPVYGLLCDQAPPILTCMGTTYPSGEGFVASVLSDFTPFTSVGHFASNYGKAEIGKWLEDKHNVKVMGMSLGGAISFHISRYHTAAISEVYVFNPPGLYPWNWKNVDHSHIDFHIYSNDNDLVSTMGFFPEGKNVNVYRVLVDETEHFLASHSRVYLASERVLVIRTSPEYENSRPERIALTVAHLTLGWLVFFAVLPFHLIFRICQFVYQQIASLCYHHIQNQHVKENAEPLRSGPEGFERGLSEGAVQA